jgi:hypothetical protein
LLPVEQSDANAKSAAALPCLCSCHLTPVALVVIKLGMHGQASHGGRFFI